jgi:hypothetical protein
MSCPYRLLDMVIIGTCTCKEMNFPPKLDK